MVIIHGSEDKSLKELHSFVSGKKTTNSNVKILITVVIGLILVTSVTVVAYEYMKDPNTQDSMY
jgi:hypothetical protein